MSLSPATTVAQLTADLTSTGTYVGGEAPRLSWTMHTDVPNWRQESVEFEIERGGDTQRVDLDTAESNLVDWPFEPLTPRVLVAVRVGVTGVVGLTAPWSHELELVGGFLAAGEWRAQMIGAADATEPATDRKSVV